MGQRAGRIVFAATAITILTWISVGVWTIVLFIVTDVSHPRNGSLMLSASAGIVFGGAVATVWLLSLPLAKSRWMRWGVFVWSSLSAILADWLGDVTELLAKVFTRGL